MRLITVQDLPRQPIEHNMKKVTHHSLMITKLRWRAAENKHEGPFKRFHRTATTATITMVFRTGYVSTSQGHSRHLYLTENHQVTSYQRHTHILHKI